MSLLRTYSARAVNIVYAGITLNDGRPDDVFITIAENADRVSFRKGMSGDTSVSLSPDHSGTITLSFFPESQAAKGLTNIYSALREMERRGDTQPANIGVAGTGTPLAVIDPSGSIILAATEAVIQSTSERSLGEDTGTISFTFFVDDMYLWGDPTAKSNVLGEVSKAVKAISV